MMINILLALFLALGCLMVLGGWRTRRVIAERRGIEARVYPEGYAVEEEGAYTPRSARAIAAILSMAGGVVTLLFIVPVIFFRVFL